MVARDTAGLCKFFHPDFQSLEQRSKVRDGHTGDRGKVLDIRSPTGLFYGEGIIGAVGRNDLRAQKALFGYTVMVFKRIGGVLRRAEGIDIRALDEILRGMLAVGKDGLGLFPYFRSGLCVERLVDAEIALKLKMCPVIDRVSDSIGQALSKGKELFKVSRIAGHETLFHAVCADNAPLVMVAQQPQFRQVIGGLILAYLLRTEMAMIINDRLRGRVLMVQFLRSLGAEQKVLIHKFLHISFPFQIFRVSVPPALRPAPDDPLFPCGAYPSCSALRRKRH